MIYERTELLKSFDGVEIFFRCFTPRRQGAKDSNIEGLVIGVHGFGEHSGRYAEVAEVVCGRGMAFAAFDLRGHGRSGPRRGDAENIHSMLLDVLFVINHSKNILGLTNASNAFFGILAHSFGGLLTVYAASVLNETCPPLFLSSPLFGIMQEVPAWKRFASKTLPSVTPLIPVPVGIKPENISENPANNGAYVSDELNLTAVTARMGQVFLHSVQENMIRHSLSLIRAPVTIVGGSKDKLTDISKVRDYLPSLTRARSTLTFIEGAGHEIFNEKDAEKAEAMRLFDKWLENKGNIT